MANPKKAIKSGLNFVKDTYSKTKKTLMTPRDHTQGGKYRFDRVGNQLIRTKVK